MALACRARHACSEIDDCDSALAAPVCGVTRRSTYSDIVDPLAALAISFLSGATTAPIVLQNALILLQVRTLFWSHAPRTCQVQLSKILSHTTDVAKRAFRIVGSV